MLQHRTDHVVWLPGHGTVILILSRDPKFKRLVVDRSKKGLAPKLDLAWQLL